MSDAVTGDLIGAVTAVLTGLNSLVLVRLGRLAFEAGRWMGSTDTKLDSIDQRLTQGGH